MNHNYQDETERRVKWGRKSGHGNQIKFLNFHFEVEMKQMNCNRMFANG